MIKIRSFKKNHSIYSLIKDITDKITIEEDIFIIGLDIVGSIEHPVYKNFFAEVRKSGSKFLCYLEEPSTFASGEASPDHWKISGSLPFNVINNIISNDNFLGFITHIKDVCAIMSSQYSAPCFYLPLCVKEKNIKKINQRIESINDYSRPINLLYWGTFRSKSQVQDPDYLSHQDIHKDEIGQYKNRGGDIIDYLVGNLLTNGFNCHYTLRFPQDHYLRQKFPNNVNIIKDYVSDEKLDEIFYNTDIFLLPADQVRACSITRAMSFGIPCLVTDAWGFNEFCLDGLNSIIIEKKNCDTCKSRGLPLCQHILMFAITKISELIDNRQTLYDLSKHTLLDSNINYKENKYITNIQNLFDYLDIK